jgi:hypothetical protein
VPGDVKAVEGDNGKTAGFTRHQKDTGHQDAGLFPDGVRAAPFFMRKSSHVELRIDQENTDIL